MIDKNYESYIVDQVKDPVVKAFWQEEFANIRGNQRLFSEAIQPIQNKVGQFTSNPLIRNILGQTKSSFDFRELMDDKKIVIINLSKGRIGEGNANLIGSMLITKIYLAAMSRASATDADLKKLPPFYLYVDEFQNFATTSFIKILSEARKYKLNLMMANQYMAQIPIDVQKAILGNAGSIVSFNIGAEDARIIMKEFGEVFTDKDLVNLENYQIAVRLMIDAMSGRAFVARTLPLPNSRNENRSKVIRVSRERWGR